MESRTASSTPSSRDSTWNGKLAPSAYLHKRFDIIPHKNDLHFCLKLPIVTAFLFLPRQKVPRSFNVEVFVSLIHFLPVARHSRFPRLRSFRWTSIRRSWHVFCSFWPCRLVQSHPHRTVRSCADGFRKMEVGEVVKDVITPMKTESWKCCTGRINSRRLHGKPFEQRCCLKVAKSARKKRRITSSEERSQS